MKYPGNLRAEIISVGRSLPSPPMRSHARQSEYARSAAPPIFANPVERAALVSAIKEAISPPRSG